MKVKQFTNQEEWLKFRENYVTASEMASLVGLNPHQTANQLLQQKIDGNTKDSILEIHSRRGHILEDAVAAALRYDLNWSVEKNGLDVYYDEEFGLSATPDAFRLNKSGTKIAVTELKTTGNRTFNNYWRQKKPFLNYVIQTYVQMMLTDFNKGYLACLTTTEVDAVKVKKFIPSYYGTNSVVDVSLAVFKVKRCELLDRCFIEQSKLFRHHKKEYPEKRFTVSTELKDTTRAILERQIEFIGLYESIPYVGDDLE